MKKSIMRAVIAFFAIAGFFFLQALVESDLNFFVTLLVICLVLAAMYMGVISINRHPELWED